MSLCKHLFTRPFQSLRPHATSHASTNPSPTILPASVPIEEEKIPGYNSKNFYPANPGDLLNKRYRIIAKVGWGTTSTVWLAQDTHRWWWKPNRYVTLKIAVCGFDNDDAAKHERNINRSIKTDTSHSGLRLVRVILDNFEVIGPYGKHLCFVYEPMREPLWLLQERLPDNKIPGPMVKACLSLFLKALDYLHSECNIVHTDLKMDNILVGFEEPYVLKRYIEKQVMDPMPRKMDDEGRLVYLCHNNFGPLQSRRIMPKLADFGLARYIKDVDPMSLRLPIQPRIYQAPEVLLGTGWGYSADIWNLGLLIWNMLEGKDLFQHTRQNGKYEVRAHLAEMIALLGPPPKDLIEKEMSLAHLKWNPTVPNSEGKLCHTPREYYRGPYFHSSGEFMHKDLIPSDVSLESSVPSLEDADDKRLFLDFVRSMLRWLPEERKTAKELLEHPWLIVKRKG